MAGEEKKKQSVPDEVNGGGYDDTKNTSTGVGAGANGYDSVYGTGSVVFPEVAQGNNAYQQWLKNQGLDIEGAYQQKVQQAQQAYAQSLAQNRAAYERQLGTYGANAERLAQSGLASSGYSDYLAGQAYAAQQAGNAQAGQALALSQQAALESAQGTAQEQYANYMSQVNKQTEDIYSSLQSTGGKLSDEAKKYYETLGYSPEAITKAETLYSQYQATPEYKAAQAQGAQNALLSGDSKYSVGKQMGDSAVNDAIKNITQFAEEYATGDIDTTQLLANAGIDASMLDDEAKKNAVVRLLATSTSDAAREKWVNNELQRAAEEDDEANQMMRYIELAQSLEKFKDYGVDIQELGKEIANKLGVSIEMSSDGDIKMDYNWGGKHKFEYAHTTNRASEATQARLNKLPSNISVVVDGDNYYIKRLHGAKDEAEWWEVKTSSMSKKHQLAFKALAALQAAGYNYGYEKYKAIGGGENGYHGVTIK